MAKSKKVERDEYLENLENEVIMLAAKWFNKRKKTYIKSRDTKFNESSKE